MRRGPGRWPDHRTPLTRAARLAVAGTALLAAPAVGAVGVAWGQPSDPAQALESVEERLAAERAARADLQAKREALAEELRRVRAQVIDSAAAIQDAEENLSRLESRLTALRAERARIAETLSLRDEQLARVLTAIQRLAWRPTEALLVQPAPPADTVRGAILLRAAIPQIEERARVLARELESLSGLDAAISAQRAEIAAETAALKAAHGRLEALFDRKAALQRDTLEREREAALRVDRLGEEAASLRDLMERLRAERDRRDALAALTRAMAARAAGMAAAEAAAQEQEAAGRADADRSGAGTRAGAGSPSADAGAGVAGPPMPPEEPAEPVLAAAPARAFASGKGTMPMPARGPLLTRYGEPDDMGGASKGVTVRTRPGAQVVAPFDGTVAFAGPFRGYGLLLIIEHTDGYHSLLAGMSRLDARVGQSVRAGEPVGIMAGGLDTVPGTATGAAAGTAGAGGPTLYIELRRDGRPINPLPWLAAGSDTGKG
ncbi:murein hydrolase activator EnvC family protein [Roseospira goensis]|uniref:Septal ring factor EnvC (AmiA/AmiB activator) n=1 Tax=Roseospira goensis TaxID=391922 RepID=A0A7W6S0D7_9PROT|nr:peptidoglycan DD-metalloendopeptidase family protein [Roseospira goensis]MBB4286565.1 septal ring factor EnvC (AmiA/AmiB activator) [Roseospira goensis]